MFFKIMSLLQWYPECCCTSFGVNQIGLLAARTRVVVIVLKWQIKFALGWLWRSGWWFWRHWRRCWMEAIGYLFTLTQGPLASTLVHRQNGGQAHDGNEETTRCCQNGHHRHRWFWFVCCNSNWLLGYAKYFFFLNPNIAMFDLNWRWWNFDLDEWNGMLIVGGMNDGGRCLVLGRQFHWFVWIGRADVIGMSLLKLLQWGCKSVEPSPTPRALDISSIRICLKSVIGREYGHQSKHSKDK